MDELRDKLEKALHAVAEQLHDIGLQSRDVEFQALATKLERLARQVPEPCVVAVVGRINSGKSTFINALLQEDLAKVGPTETTATINYFRYGKYNSERPVRCHWRGKKPTNESRQFLDNLQSTSIEALQRANGIDYLEYHLKNNYLKEITLVDTPGTGAVERERQRRTEAFLNLYHQRREAQQTDEEKKVHELYDQLQEYHQRETLRIGSEADAVIYLVGEIPRADEQAFLDEFQHVTQGQSRSLNAIGIMAKIDLNDEVIERREALAKKIAGQLQQELNTVIPISAGLESALGVLQATLEHLIADLRAIPSAELEVLLAAPEGYLEIDTAISPDQWKQLQGEMPWSVFTTIAHVVVDNPSLNASMIAEQLKAIAGFDQVHTILKQHFIERESFLRCYRITHDALEIREMMRTTYRVKFIDRDNANRTKINRFLSFIRQRQDNSPTARELEEFIEEHLAPRVDQLDKVIHEMEDISKLSIELEEDNKDFEALKIMEDHSVHFTGEELSELHSLFGLSGREVERRLPPAKISLAYIEERQRYWNEKSRALETVVADVAKHAVHRYGWIFMQIFKQEGAV